MSIWLSLHTLISDSTELESVTNWTKHNIHPRFGHAHRFSLNQGPYQSLNQSILGHCIWWNKYKPWKRRSGSQIFEQICVSSEDMSFSQLSKLNWTAQTVVKQSTESFTGTITERDRRVKQHHHVPTPESWGLWGSSSLFGPLVFQANKQNSPSLFPATSACRYCIIWDNIGLHMVLFVWNNAKCILRWAFRASKWAHQGQTIEGVDNV